MSTKPLILLGSARKTSDTGKLVTSLFPGDSATVVDLLDYTIAHYRYDGLYPPEDDFPQLVELLQQQQQVVFATPVYWYTMSGLMKVFFDRLTDLVTLQKQTGRKLKGKQAFLIAVGAEETLPLGFEEPFRLTSAYFDMQFKATLYCRTSEIYVNGTTAETFLRSLTAETTK